MRDAAIGVALALATLAALGVPLPRLIATGCTHHTLTAGIALAREESDFIGTCRSVARLPWVTE